ncbi:MAG TPA: hypothetical protein DCL77_18090 [Prolixibacteraceae bacterium]|nr:hypothetical protein [Prolixibacteraceae bacterium]
MGICIQGYSGDAAGAEHPLIFIGIASMKPTQGAAHRNVFTFSSWQGDCIGLTWKMILRCASPRVGTFIQLTTNRTALRTFVCNSANFNAK